MFSVPANANAGIFSSILGNTNAGAPDATNYVSSDSNLQNMSLLQANVSSASILQGGNGEISSKDDVNVLSDNALLASTSPTGTSDGIDNGESISDQISVYVIRKGDSLSQIAEMYGVSTNTILWANNMKKGDKLVEGNVLVILPIDGVKHLVLKGQTIKGIAQKYNADAGDIASFNGISGDSELIAGEEIIIPDANVDSPDPVKKTTNSKTKVNYEKTPTKNVPGYFINPVPNFTRRSQGLHDRVGIDLAAPTGTKIIAAASGRVIFARNGYNGGYGNMVIIQHPNGTTTLYGHMSKIATTGGEQVSQGELIGYIGSTGRSTGPHIHFEVRGAKNPGATTPMSWAKR